jgi:hypothetical protein
MTAIVIVAIAVVSAVALAALAYSVPKLYWYRQQVLLLNRAQDDSSKLIDTHIADHTTDVDTINVSPAEHFGDYL